MLINCYNAQTDKPKAISPKLFRSLGHNQPIPSMVTYGNDFLVSSLPFGFCFYCPVGFFFLDGCPLVFSLELFTILT